jgi:hypothetical protein
MSRKIIARMSAVSAASALAIGAVLVAAGPASAASTRDQIVSVAQGQEGHHACDPGYYGSCGINWCAEFARWVWAHAGVSDVDGLDSYAQSFKTYGQARGTYHSRTSGYTPQPGDAILFDWDHSSTDPNPIDHVGIVDKVDSSNVSEVGGNQGNSDEMLSVVSEDTYSRTYANIDGYVEPVGLNSATSGHVEHEVQDASGVWSGLRPIHGNATYFDGSSVAVAATPDGSAQVLAVGTDGIVYHDLRHVDGTWTGWAAPHGANGVVNFAASAVAATGMPDGSAQFLAAGKNGNVLYHAVRYADGTWEPFRALPGNGGASNFAGPKMSIAGLADGSSQVVAIGVNGMLYGNTRYADGTWAGWQPLPGNAGANWFGASDVSIAATGNGTAQVVAIGQDGAVHHIVHNADGTWGAWVRMQGNGGASYFGGPSVTIAGYPDGTSRVVAIGLNAGVYEDVRSADGTWSGWTNLTLTPSIQVAAAGTWANNTLQLIDIVQ